MAENAISCWKQASKRSLTSRKDEFISPTGEIMNGRTLQQFRFDTINDIISSTASEVPQNSNPHDTTPYLPACIGREEIDG